MKKQVANVARREVQKSGVTHWLVIIVTAVAIVIAFDPYGHVHHWAAVCVIAIVGIILAALTEKWHRRGRA
jgi:hypothetical protein